MKRKNVALIGSTGGGTATLGHTDVTKLLETIHDHLLPYGASLEASGYVALDHGKGMDAVDVNSDMATLYTTSVSKSGEFQCQSAARGPLRIVNEHIKNAIDNDIAECIETGTIDALICISCNPLLHERTFRAAAIAKIPVTGSGGTSLSQMSSLYGIDLVGNAGGSVATTTSSRAMSYSYALAQHWNRTSANAAKFEDSWNIAEFRSVLNASLPAFWTCCLLKFILQRMHEQPFLEEWKEDLHTAVEVLTSNALPIACAVTMAQNNIENSRESIQIAALLVALMVCQSSIMGGLLSGWMVRTLHHRIMERCITYNVPATMTTLATTGLVTLLVAMASAPIVPLLTVLTENVRAGIITSAHRKPIGGFLWGVFVCYGSKVGWYHSIILPLILIEMETANASFLGAVDYLALVLVCAGVCAAQLVIGDPDHTALCRRGLRTNILFGDFVEACYPFMDQYPIINISCYLASGLASAILVADGLPRGMAYLPCVGSVALVGQHHMIAMAIASCIAFFVPFLSSLLVFLVKKWKVT